MSADTGQKKPNKMSLWSKRISWLVNMFWTWTRLWPSDLLIQASATTAEMCDTLCPSEFIFWYIKSRLLQGFAPIYTWFEIFRFTHDLKYFVRNIPDFFFFFFLHDGLCISFQDEILLHLIKSIPFCSNNVLGFFVSWPSNFCIILLSDKQINTERTPSLRQMKTSFLSRR